MTDSATNPATLNALVNHAALRLAYSRLLHSVAFTIGASMLFVGLLLPHFPGRALAGWFVGIQAVAIGRLALWYWHRRVDPGMGQARTWSRRFLAGSFAAAASWSIGAVALMPQAGHFESAVLCVTLLAVASVAVSSLTAHLPSLLTFLLTCLGPLAITLLRADTSIEQVVGLALLASIVALAWTGWQSNGVLQRLLRTDLELQASIEQTRAAQAAAEQASRAKSTFLATMSHEVRTPLNGILGLADLLEGTELAAPQRRHLRLLRQSGDNLRVIVDDILDFSRIEAGQMPLACEPFDPRRLLQDIFELWQPRARNAGLGLRLEVGVDLPHRVRGDAQRIRQILDNFLGNATKFTARGAIMLRVEPGDGEAFLAGQTVRLHFAVRDTGIGIAPEALERVFDAFTQAEESWSRRFGGSGLGLAICRRLATLMGGTIGAESTPDVGSTFWLSLPLTVAAPDVAASAGPTVGMADAPQSTPAAAVSADRAAGRVLMVEDNAINRAVCGAMLERLGLEFTEACDGIEALEKATDREFDLVLMDCQMPRLDGYAATRAMRQRGILARDGQLLPIVALTANALAEDRERTRAAGMDDFLAKPVRLEQLRLAIAQWTVIRDGGDGR